MKFPKRNRLVHLLDHTFCGVTYGALLFASVQQKGRHAYIHGRLSPFAQHRVVYCKK